MHPYDKAKLRVDWCYKEVKTKTGIILPEPDIRIIRLKNGWAGAARYNHLTKIVEINLNPQFLLKYTDDFIERTIPHEVCHAVAQFQHGKNGNGHGVYWRKYMKEVFGLFPWVHHIYGVEKLWVYDGDGD